MPQLAHMAPAACQPSRVPSVVPATVKWSGGVDGGDGGGSGGSGGRGGAGGGAGGEGARLKMPYLRV